MAEFGWTTLSGEPHYGEVTGIDSNVIYVQCRYCGKEVCTEAEDEEVRAFQRTDPWGDSRG